MVSWRAARDYFLLTQLFLNTVSSIPQAAVQLQQQFGVVQPPQPAAPTASPPTSNNNLPPSSSGVGFTAAAQSAAAGALGGGGGGGGGGGSSGSSGVGVGGVRRNYAGWREWRRADPTLINTLWRNKMGNGIRKQLGNAEVYIMLALLIGLATVVIGCWLSDNCWSPEQPEHVLTLA